MPINTKTTKQEITAYAKRLEKALTAYREGYYTDGRDQWFAVAPYGWGSWEDDACFVEARSPSDALDQAHQLYELGDYEGSVIVYNVVEVGVYRRVIRETVWEKQNE